jgi:hypothetical protein
MINAEQASDALRTAAASERRSADAYNYSQTAPYCFVWALYGCWVMVPRRWFRIPPQHGCGWAGGGWAWV